MVISQIIRRFMMSAPVEGEPYFAYPGPAISAGDPGAAPGTDAWEAVAVLDPGGIPSTNIIDAGATFNLQVRFRTAVPAVWPLPPGFSVNFHVQNWLTGVNVATVTGTTAPLSSPPTGDSGPRGVGDIVNWYSSTSAPIGPLPSGTYRILVHGHESTAGLMFFHEGTRVHVGI